MQRCQNWRVRYEDMQRHAMQTTMRRSHAHKIMRWQVACPWLARGRHLGMWKCQLCSVAGSRSPWGLGLAENVQASHLRTHELSRQHIRAAHPGEDASHPRFIRGKLVPAAAAFEAVVECICLGSNRGGLRPKVGCAGTVRRLTYCLGEGARYLTIAALEAAESISLSQDGRKLRMCMHFGCCSSDLSVRRFGLLGCLNLGEILQDVSAAAIAAASLQIIDDLATPLEPPPGCPGMSRIQYPDLAAHVKDRAECLAADAAADEQLAMEMLGAGAHFPNVKILNRDTAHAARRVNSRSSEADPFIRDVLQRFLLGGKGLDGKPVRAVMQLISHSPMFKAKFAAAVAAEDLFKGCQPARDLRSAKHRHESLQKPTGRGVWLPGCWRCVRHAMMKKRREQVMAAWSVAAGFVLG